MKAFDEVIRFHGHTCPGLALGYRVALAALRELDIKEASIDEEIVAIVENDSCAVDAIQVITGCTFGKGNLIFKDYGKQVYTFIKKSSGDAVRISIDFIPMPETEEEKLSWQRFSQGDRSTEVLKLVHERKTKKIQAILNSPEGVLLKISKMKLHAPPEAKIYPTVRCEVCNEKVAESKLRMKSGKRFSFHVLRKKINF